MDKEANRVFDSLVRIGLRLLRGLFTVVTYGPGPNVLVPARLNLTTPKTFAAGDGKK